MDEPDQAKTQFLSMPKILEIVTIFVIICGKTEPNENGQFCLTERGKKQVRKSIKKNLQKILPFLRPEFFCGPPKLYAAEMIMELAKMLPSGLNSKSILALPELDLPNAPEEVVVTDYWFKRARECADLKWYDRHWRKKIRSKHWLDAGGKSVEALRESTENALLALVLKIARRPDRSTQPIGIIAGNPAFWNLVKYNRNKFPPLRPGDIIKYEFRVDGMDIGSVKITDLARSNILPA
jgi:hypothetical protein